jgi:hypothetical protein
MIIKGDSVAGGKRIADHLLRADTNEKVEVLETRGVVSEDAHGALREMEAVASLARNCERPFYHASINTPAHEPLTAQQRDLAIDRLEKELGLTGQPRLVVAHVKEGREHVHIAWSRFDCERMRVLSDSHNYRKHEKVARSLEREFGHEAVQGVHVEREGKDRPLRTPSHKQMQQAERTKLPVAEVKAHVSQLWQTSETGAAFQEALKQSGFTLAKGDRRDFVVIDFAGGVHSLSRVTGEKSETVRDRLQMIDREALPSVDDARKTVKQRSVAAATDDRAAHQAVVDGLRLGGSQSMAKIQQVQLDLMKRRAEDAYRDRWQSLSKKGEAVQEQTDRKIAKQGKQKVVQDKLDAEAKHSSGKGDIEQERN